MHPTPNQIEIILYYIAAFAIFGYIGYKILGILGAAIMIIIGIPLFMIILLFFMTNGAKLIIRYSGYCKFYKNG